MAHVWRAWRQKELPENYFRVEVNILRSLGIELLKKETPLYIIYSRIVLFLIVIVFTFTEVYEIYAQWGNLNIILGVCSYLITHITGGIKTSLLFINRKKIGNMMKSLQKVPFKPDPFRGGDVEEREIRAVIKKTETQLLAYFLVVSGTIFSGGINVFIDRLVKPKEEWVFPFAPTLTIVPLGDSPWYELGCVYQWLSVISYALIIATTYVLLSSIMAHISIQLRILGNSFRNIRTRALKMQKIDSSRSLDFYIKVAMKDSIEHHLLVLDVAKEMESLCNLMILAVFLASIFLLCFTLYGASLAVLGSVPFFQNACYWCIIVCQVGMYCYWGNEVSLEAEKVAIAVSEADWIEAPPSIGKATVMVIRRAYRPLNITAGKFVPLCMAVFMSIIKGSFSYFMMLRQMQGYD